MTRAVFTLASILPTIELLRQFFVLSALAPECKWPISEATWLCWKFAGRFFSYILGGKLDYLKIYVKVYIFMLVIELVAQRIFCYIILIFDLSKLHLQRMPSDFNEVCSAPSTVSQNLGGKLTQKLLISERKRITTKHL